METRYYFDKRQRFCFSIYLNDVGHFRSYGIYECELSDILSSKNQCITGEMIYNKNSIGSLTIFAEKFVPKVVEETKIEMNHKILNPLKRYQDFVDRIPVYKSNDIDFQVHGEKLQKKDLLGSSDGYFTISRFNDSNEKIPIYKSEVIKNNSSPNWNDFRIDVEDISNDFDRKLAIDVWDWNAMSDHAYIGGFISTINEMKNEKSFELSKTTTKKGKNCGFFVIDSIKIVEREKKVKSKELTDALETLNIFQNVNKYWRFKSPYTFQDYLSEGLEIKLSIGIDFSFMNSLIENPHIIDSKGRPNQYQRIIKAVGSIVAQYDKNKKIPVHGFGGNSKILKIDGVIQSVKKKMVELME